MVPGTFLLPIGLLVTGWTARASVHWIVPDITYIIDAFTLHGPSALAATNVFRSIVMGFGFPLFAPSMYNALDYGKGGTILACAAIAIWIPAPFLFWVYGERLQNASHYAKRST
ncbi:hypothetical protein L226DRAFT_538960 [Lentinus tigrinus ALCF2SS1-7]|uniref:uncharacterized protein n=1 Tax=Lentinus tigrinus ALCF2SS1-7 TaxID=1328758 RepID=UPI0011660A19|nr:hypothetical protein L226DRAFT_538960 [Lentinus tigrinus ALCF2SS1-7]